MKNFLLAVAAAIMFHSGCCQTNSLTNPITIKQKFVGVDGHNMHYQFAGTGNPVVVFESGVTDGGSSWTPVFSEVARFTKAVSYDRMGLGSSDTTSAPRSFKQIAIELHSLLHNAQISPPYILVGHSMAGPMIRAFAHLYKDEIAGMVFIDCMTEYDIDGFPKDSIQKFVPPESTGKLTPQQAELNLLRQEVLSGFSELHSFGTLPEVPIHVFVGQKKIFPAVVNNRIEWYRQLVSNQNQTSLTVLPLSSHYIHRDYPGLVVSTLRQMIFPNAETELQKILQEKGVDSTIVRYKKMKTSYPHELVAEGLLNKLGYDALTRGDSVDAIKLFRLNVVMYPNSFNTYDSLAEALMKSGNVTDAIKNYKKSLQLNPENINARRMLQKIGTVK
jgi:pimeloyl-ACP methyl ester carboxylesterase